MESYKGLMIMAPMGTGKSYWINHLPYEEKDNWLDGDTLLRKHHIKNRNYFWYSDRYKKEQLIIIKLFNEYLAKGYNILYSGNPLIIPTDILIIPDNKIRYNRLLQRKKNGDYCPSKKQFDIEETAYGLASKLDNQYTIYGDIPRYNDLKN